MTVGLCSEKCYETDKCTAGRYRAATCQSGEGCPGDAPYTKSTFEVPKSGVVYHSGQRSTDV